MLLHCAHARYVWNLAVEQHAHWRRGRRSALGFAEQCRQLTAARRDNEWLAAGNADVQQQALKDFATAKNARFTSGFGEPTWRKRFRVPGRLLLAASGCAGGAALVFADLCAFAGGELGAVQFPSVGEGGGDGDAAVDADGLTGTGCGHRVGEDGERGMPLPVAGGDPERLGVGQPRAPAPGAEAEADPAAAGHLHLRPPAVQPAHHDGAAHDLPAGRRVQPRRAVRLVLGDAVGADDTETLMHERLPSSRPVRRTGARTGARRPAACSPAPTTWSASRS
ncbi:hypothetical protein [Streptomyces sp. NPDC005476]|uniref:hypothetical protein n=1 Tax=Streptomyces sp. NPDC005476 TaxID=3156882 RepID=UPI003453314A